MAYQGRQPGVGVRNRFIYTATASQTTFSGTDSNGLTLAYQDGAYVDVYLNGVLLIPVTDYTSTTKTSVTLTTGATSGDAVEILCYDIASIADTVSKSSGGTFDGAVTVAGNFSVDGGTIKLDGNYPVGTGNVALGDAALDSNVSGASNVAIGADALTANTASQNTAVGYQAGYSNTTGTNSVFIGRQAGYSTTTVNAVTAVGDIAGFSNTTGQITAVGYAALTNNTTASANTGVGVAALRFNTTGASNTALGDSALYSNTTASYNTAVGWQSLYANTTGEVNVAVGANALLDNTTASQNTAVGTNAMYSNTTGEDNVAIGHNALDANTTASNNTAVGKAALTANTTGVQNTALGALAGEAITTGVENLAVGYLSLSASTTGNGNVAVGKGALSSDTQGSSSTAVGQLALLSQNLTSATEAQNTAVGNQAGRYITTGVQNVLLGGLTRTNAGGDSRVNVIGYNVTGTEDYTTLGNDSNDIRAAHGTATWATVSDERYKKDIVDSTTGLSFINALRPRTFKYRTLGELPETFRAYEANSTKVFKNSETNHGFIAQEIKAAIDADASIKDGFRLWDDREDGSQEVAEAALIPVLVKAIQELSAKNDALEARLAALES
jgi:trimeric autotransporter adhesin